MQTAVRLALVVLILASLVLAAEMPHAFDTGGWLIAVVYVLTQVGRGAFIIWALRGEQLQKTFWRATAWSVLAAVPMLKVSGIAHDGMARAIRPVHTMFDGDTVFTLATGDRGAPDPLAFHALLDAAGDCFTRAIGRAMLSAESVQTPAGEWPSYRDAFPSAFPTNSASDGP